MAITAPPLPRDRITGAGQVREVAAMVACALVDPRRRRRDPAAPDDVLRRLGGAPTPVVLVPGYRGTGDSWSSLERRLHRDGFSTLRAVPRDADGADVPALARQLVVRCRAAMAEAGASRVHLAGHSLGGVVLRYAVSVLGLADSVGLALTIAAPHRGAAVARRGRGPVALDLRPGSPVLRVLDDAARPDGVRWTAFWSDRDLVVRPGSARLTSPALGAENVCVPSQGHLSILHAPALLEHVAARLVAAEGWSRGERLAVGEPVCAA